MKIGLTGTTSVGKTTLINELAKLPEFKDYHIATERSKHLRDLGIPLNTDSTLLGQFVFLAERARELLNENLLTDRSVYDVLAFTCSSKLISMMQTEEIIRAARHMIRYYDIIFYVDPTGVSIEDNGIRAIDAEYRDKINWMILELLAEYPPNKLVKIPSNLSVEERVNFIRDIIRD